MAQLPDPVSEPEPSPASRATSDADDRWFTPGVAGIGTASLFSDVGHEIPTSLLPSFLTATLGAPASALGAIEGISDALAGVARVGGGALADDPARRRSVAVGGYTATAVLSAGIGAATSVWQVGLLRAGAWTARGLRVPSRNALLADVVPEGAYGRAYGFERAMDNLGAILGPLLAIALVAAVGARTAILVSVVPGLFAVVAITYAIRHTHQPERRERTPIRLRLGEVFRGSLGRLMGGISVFEIANVAATMLILRASGLFEADHGHDRAVQLALWLYVAYNVAATVMSPVAGRIVDRTGAVPVLAAGAASFAGAYAWFAAGPSSPAALLPAFMLAGIGIGLAETAQHAAVAITAPESIRGSAFGALAGVQSLGNLIASVGTGLVWTLASPGVAFTILAIAMAVAAPAILTASGRA